MNREEFLRVVKEYIETDPEAAAYVADYVQAGITTKLEKLSQNLVDMETIAVALASRKHRGSDELIKSKLRNLEGHTNFDWDWYTNNKHEAT